MAKISEIAADLGKKPNIVVTKAKELGLNIKGAMSTVNDEEAQRLYDYITKGVDTHATSKPHKESKKETISNTDSKKEASSLEESEDSTSKTTKAKTQNDKEEFMQTALQDKTLTPEASAQESLESKTTPPSQTNTKDLEKEVKLTPTKDKIRIVSTPKVETKQTPTKTDFKDEISSLQDMKNQDARNDTKKDLPIINLNKPEIKQAIQEIKNDLNNTRLESNALPRPVEQDVRKTYGRVRVVSKNQTEEVAPRNDKKPKIDLANANETLAKIKLASNETSKPRKEKKKDISKAPAKSAHHHAQYLELDRELGFGSYDDDEEEVVLLDLREQEPKNEDEIEKVRKAVNDKIRLNRYSPYMQEGSIKRSSRKSRNKGMDKNNQKNEANNLKEILIPEDVRVYEFADKAGIELNKVLGVLFNLGLKVLKNDFLDRDTIEILANEFGINVKIQSVGNEVLEEVINDQDLVERPPVVTIMGHVDHGKTSLLDKIRNSRIASKEAGGITQHIGAYMVEKNGKKISFIDTPGHEAFAQMRSRGAQVTDIAIIVIAADDGVKQQSIEALNHAKNANVQIIIAMNKMDKENANPDKLKSECAELGFTPSDWGGNYDFIPLSAKSGEGIDLLLETILIQAELLELKASQKARPKAVVLEGSQQKGKGSVATIIVQQGILKVGMSVVADTAYGKIRSMQDDLGNELTELHPSEIAQITGLNEVPLAGSALYYTDTDSEAREQAMKRSAYLRQKALSKTTKVTFDELSTMVAQENLKSLPIILRADTQGSLEALKNSLLALSNDEVQINVISVGVGSITLSDVNLASASTNCIILGFNIKASNEIKNEAKNLGVTLKTYSIIYDLLDEVKLLIGGMMSPLMEEEITGEAVIRELFTVAKVGVIAGCMVNEGVIEKNLHARVIRNGTVVHEGKIASLKRFKDDVREVKKGFECGIMLEGFNDLKAEDVIETYKQIAKKREL
ncbi:translation initiation factor IF-2 [Helicobacter sp. 13S00401-1]|uniref:translation initiation factor IF-2 n=1 Tax=Helicobacter sp. 13S00401-1 TaxID=1905758 RepID=UPI000BA7B2A5|nr:translation initiation factor IF-2 [Helicobacter sp. 13S00401-1]PAF50725.1 translation initiation factor IF-2 [Helicobacter sp. 13S00401-1]